ncbi:MAG: chorismate synthase, partial [Bacteroidetes bacterium]
MNQYGTLFTVTIFGESHGPKIGIVIGGCPAGLALTPEHFLYDLERRKGGNQKGTTPRKEADYPIIVSGVFNGFTTGAPITILFENANTRSGDYEKLRAIPRPGHADFVAHKKFGGFEDYRGGGHFSGRLTTCLVAIGVVAKLLLQHCGVSIRANIDSIRGMPSIQEGLQKAIAAKDSVGGVLSCTVTGVPIGWGQPFFNSLESEISKLVFAIPAIRGIEFGTGFAAAEMLGSEHNDAIENTQGTTTTNHAGGIVGGISNGNDLFFKVAVKPTSSTPKPQQTLNWETGETDVLEVKGRHDLCIALRVPPVLEAVTALALADAALQMQAIPTVLPKQASSSHIVYHIVSKSVWETASLQETYTPEGFASEGFIHLCEKHQVAGVIQRYYVGVNDLLLLHIDAAHIAEHLRYEQSPTLYDWFPHLYNALPISAVNVV